MTSGFDVLAILSAISSAVAAIAAAAAIILSLRERQVDMKEDFVLWAIERLRDKDLRESRRMIYNLRDGEWQEIVKAAGERQDIPRLDEIRRVCLSFDEIGYFVYKVGLVNFRDILDMYPQTVRVWNKVRPVIAEWRRVENPTAFIYFEMLARQERLTVKPDLEQPVKLYPNQ